MTSGVKRLVIGFVNISSAVYLLTDGLNAREYGKIPTRPAVLRINVSLKLVVLRIVLAR